MCRVLEKTFLIIHCVSWAAAQEGLVVQTVQGLLRGVAAADGDYNMFLGIRYGTVDQTNRFKEASPPPSWDGIRDAKEDIIQQCPQPNNPSSEDCLLLNVYVPKNTTASSPFPVMVLFHGGQFRNRDASYKSFGPQFLVRNGVIMVAMNYRVGPFGFLCLGTEEIPGNAGLKDKVHALRWVRDNIAAFGGDPDNVTIFGVSSGGASVDYFIVSPMARGLFHKAIAQSGSAIAFWANQAQAAKNAFTLGSQLGISTTDIYELQDRLLKVNTSAILQAEITKMDMMFVPCIENTSSGAESFITSSPYSILSSGNYSHVPYMTGYTNEDGGFMLTRYMINVGWQKLRNNFQDILPKDMKFSNQKMRNEFAQKVYQFYFGNDDLSIDKAKGFVDLFTDTWFSYPSEMTVRLRLQHSDQPIYFYEFRYDGNLNYMKGFERAFVRNYVNLTGSFHGDEFGYLMLTHDFKYNGTSIPNADAEDLLMVDRITLLWTNFAKYGNPTPETNVLLPVIWPPVTSDSSNYLILDKELKVDQNPLRERLAFWKDSYEQYYDGHILADDNNEDNIFEEGDNFLRDLMRSL